ncbi:MAG: hypothetical protein PQ612_03300 [Rickettsiales bacterium]|nr:hypothetical protein [Pseudomonadota bacterium]MDA0965861.1 hypothetical protein [Pseudomonadota bacterium]MDG4542669.1 hypothetical protein [Rickettsiales bacterium]MDG4545173.1 hypothetical protein [Rickettsiales bacterium]MDG4547296.1 hypothetical protein [Rickettsiales bacterium]
MKAIKFFLIAVILVIVAAVAYLYSSLNDVVKKGIETVGSDVLGVQVTVSKVDISLKEGSAEITGLNIGNPSGYKSDNAFSLGMVRLAIEPASITTGVIRIKDLSIVSPKINYEFVGGKSNIDTIKNNISKGKDSSSGSQKDSGGRSGRNSKSFVIDNILFTDAAVNSYIGQLEKTINLPEISIQNIGTNENPASAKQVATIVISQIVNSVLKNTDLNSLGADLKGAGNALKDKVKGIGGGLKGVFGQ